MLIGYARVSTRDQNEARQIEYLKSKGVEKIFCDKESGKDFDRAQYLEMKEFTREGDKIHIMELSRFGRDLKGILTELQDLLEKGVRVEIGQIGEISKNAPLTIMLIQIMGAVAEFERVRILEAQRKGIELAKERGVYKKPKDSKTKRIDFEKEVLPMLELGVKKTQIARRLGISAVSFYKMLHRYDAERKYYK